MMEDPEKPAAPTGLVPLDEIDNADVADGYTDVRGFDAYIRDGRRVGDVKQLLVDPGSYRVAAIAVDVSQDLLELGRIPRAHVPIEHVEIDTAARRIFIEGLGVEFLGLADPSA